MHYVGGPQPLLKLAASGVIIDPSDKKKNAAGEVGSILTFESGLRPHGDPLIPIVGIVVPDLRRLLTMNSSYFRRY